MEVKVSDASFHLFSVYGPNSTIGKKLLWETISQSISNYPNAQVVIAGDFNAILSLKDKIGGIVPPFKIMQDFNDFIRNNTLKDCIPLNGHVTWTNKRKCFMHIV